jgi:hypothetical protein
MSSNAGLLWRISGGKITAMQSDWATIEIDGVQRTSIGVPRRPTSCCRGDDGHRERYCKQTVTSGLPSRNNA